MQRKQIYKEKICPYCKSQCNKNIEIIKKGSIICTRYVNYKPKKTNKRKAVPSCWQGW